MKKGLLLAVLLVLVAAWPLPGERSSIKVGSKKFTESVILAEMTKGAIESADETATHYRELGGTRLVYQSLLNGDIDAYPEYTGTISEEILSGRLTDRQGPEIDGSIAKLREALAEDGVSISDSLGFNNTYVLAMNKQRADELGIDSISDLQRHPDLVCGFSSEFLDREDGWKNLVRHYQLPQTKVAGLDHDLAYRQLKLGAIEVTDAYATDAKASVYDLRLLIDDDNFFPKYEAVILYRDDLANRFPDATTAMLRLQGKFDASKMMSANARVEIDRVSEQQTAAELLRSELGVSTSVTETTLPKRLLARTLEHLDLVRKSLIPAIFVAIPLGIAAVKWPGLGHLILGIVGVFQTIPALAMLVILMPLIAWLGLTSIGLGSITAVVALFLYCLLPIVRNTHAGLSGIPSGHLEAAAALGLPARFRLFRVELPLASASILAGIKTAAVLSIGFATLGALIGAGGYGQPIISGIRLNETAMILEGAIPAAILALFTQACFDFADRLFVPRGLRLPSGR